MNSKAKIVFDADYQASRLAEGKIYLKQPNMQAFLKAIGDAEGADYNLKYGGVKGKVHDKYSFADFSTHPGAGYGGKATPAGMYQITNGTWADIGSRIGLTDFSPDTQDLMAVEILRIINSADDIVAGNITSALLSASRRWAALPKGPGLPSRYNQPYMEYEQFIAKYHSYGGLGK
ncbi:hypothetical protein BWP39_06870 [Paraburkholderia acidicola]|uniref:Paar repeat-containing protein n=1 Tax=Paraburkholderia acidicola TaxID=1912599 RepID=A0A2A4F6D6_9BURK|nr:paar repeat-containing protein [Paraburkholderia acidicola]PCE28230.1 hypothetical protein BWP39_06870 [Paraburkholderia acidicola]